MGSWKRWVLVPFLALGLCACDGEEAADDAEVLEGAEDEIVWRGKEDNFLSMSAQEYILTGQATVVLDAAFAHAVARVDERSLTEDQKASWSAVTDEELAGWTMKQKLELVQALIPLKNIQFGWFLNVFLVEKKEDDANHGYGGYHALVREGSYKAADIVADPDDALTFHYTVSFEIGGERELLSHITELEKVEGDTYKFTLQMARVDNRKLTELEVNSEWYRRYGSWKPEGKSEDQLESIELLVRPEPRSPDAYFDTQRLFEDGLVTVGVHFGWDYHSDYHLKHSESLYNWLLGIGFESPVEAYADYVPGGDEHSGPLTRTIKAQDKDVRVEVSLFWGKPDTVTDPDTGAGGMTLENDMLDSFATREIIAYSGHSGPYYGFALANWRKTDEGDLDDSEIPGMEMPEDEYQVVLAEGCDTYGIGEAFWHNPAKADQQNLDVITTTAPSNASTPNTLKDFLGALVGTDRKDQHEPKKVSELLKDLDSNSYWFHTMYGLHGIDDNPRRHPFAIEENLCQSGCRSQEDCGGYGNRCVTLHQGQDKVCSFECVSDVGCPDGYSCERVASSGYSSSNFACVPRSRMCGKANDVKHGRLEQSGELEKDEEVRYTIQLSEGLERLLLTMKGDGDADLYVRRGEAPTTSEYDCRPYKGSSDEECSFDSPAAGPWHVMVRGYRASSYDLVGTW